MGIEADWKWIEDTLLAEILALDDPDDQEAFALAKFCSIVQNQELDTDEKSSDAKFRQAARSWRQIFRIPESERLVNCAYFFSVLHSSLLLLL